ncbi:hypothetical protein NMG60_11015859 [Bertholletia excelsa]
MGGKGGGIGSGGSTGGKGGGNTSGGSTGSKGGGTTSGGSTGGMMKAPGAGGSYISRVGFEANPKGYFEGLHGNPKGSK